MNLAVRACVDHSLVHTEKALPAIRTCRMRTRASCKRCVPTGILPIGTRLPHAWATSLRSNAATTPQSSIRHFAACCTSSCCCCCGTRRLTSLCFPVSQQALKTLGKRETDIRAMVYPSLSRVSVCTRAARLRVGACARPCALAVQMESPGGVSPSHPAPAPWRTRHLGTR